MGLSFYIICAVLLIVTNALLVAAEYALIRLRYSHFNEALLERLKQTPRVSPLIEKPDLSVRIIRLGIIMCTMGYGLIAYLGLAKAMPAVAEGALVIIAFVVASGLFYAVAELVPRGLALHYPFAALDASSWLVRVWAWVARPIVALFSRLTAFLLKLLGVSRNESLEMLSVEAQLDALGVEVPEMSEILTNIIKNTLKLRKLEVHDVLLSRNQLQWFDINDGNEENLKIARKTGHTRFPLCDGDLDKCVGLIHIKDLFRASVNPVDLDWMKYKRDIMRFGINDPLDTVLQKLMRAKGHMALVVDEFGGTEGVLTLESILEEIVGQIQDEFDSEEARIKLLRPGEFLVSGLTPLHELEEELGVSFNNEEVATFGGLITAEIGRIPERRESVSIGNIKVIITDVDGKRVIATRVSVR